MSRHDKVLSRRKFLRKGVGIVGGMSAIAALSEYPDLPPLISTTVPVWHPDVTAFHSANHLTVRLPITGHESREITLSGTDASLWCQCDGSLAELALAHVQMLESNCSADEARRQVLSFLEPLYRQGFLVRKTPDVVATIYSRELESSLLEMETKV